MGNYKGQGSPATSWIVLSLAAVVQVIMSQPMLTSSVQQVCPGESITFTCTTTGSSILAWRSEDYIGSIASTQYEFRSIDGNGTVRNSNPETVATLISNNGPMLTSVLRIIARSTTLNISISCVNAGGGTSTSTVPLAAVPGVPEMINAAEISRPRDNLCIILVTWGHPANSDASDIDQYIVYIPSRNIREVSSSTISTLTISNCGDDIRIQIAAMNRFGCVGINSSEIQITLLTIPTVATEDGPSTTGGGSVTTEGESTSTSTSVVAAASVAAVLFIILCFIIVLGLAIIFNYYKKATGKKIEATVQMMLPDTSEKHVEAETNLTDAPQNIQGTSTVEDTVKHNLEDLYNALKLKLPSRNMQIAARSLRKTLMSDNKSANFNEDVKVALISCLERIQSEKGEDVQKAFKNLDNTFTGMAGINEELMTSVRSLRTQAGHTEILDELIKKVEKIQPHTIVDILLTLSEKLRNIRQVKDYYCKQSKYDIGDLGTEMDRVSVPIWVDEEVDDTWKGSLCKAVQAINEAAPGLSLSITEDKDKNQAIIHVLAIDKKEPYTEIEGNILIRLKEKHFVTKIRLGKWEDKWKKGVCIHELTHALGFEHDHQYAIADPYKYHLDSGKKITIDKNDLGLIRFDSLCTTLYPCEKKCRGHSEADVCTWVLEAYPTQVNTEHDELDMIALNLVYPPCVDETANNVRYKPKLGRNGMYYCGRKIMILSDYPNEKYNKFCGPDKGPNCSACRTIKSPRVEEILNGGRWQGMTGRVYCGRLFTEPAKLSKLHDGMCGMNDGPACPECYNILNKEESAYSTSESVL